MDLLAGSLISPGSRGFYSLSVPAEGALSLQGHRRMAVLCDLSNGIMSRDAGYHTHLPPEPFLTALGLLLKSVVCLAPSSATLI